MEPPAAPDDGPVAIEMEPELPPLVAPVETETLPESFEAVAVAAPEPIEIAPELSEEATEAAVFIEIVPDTAVADEPLVIVTAPPLSFSEPPELNVIALPVPLVLTPTTILIAPPRVALDEPLLIVTAPASFLAWPDDNAKLPEEDAVVSKDSPDEIDTSPESSSLATAS